MGIHFKHQNQLMYVYIPIFTLIKPDKWVHKSNKLLRNNIQILIIT